MSSRYSTTRPLDPLSLVCQALDQLGEGVDALVDLAVAAGDVAGVDALEDDRQLPVAEGDVEVEVGEVAAGALGVAADQLLAGRKAGRQVGGLAQRDRLLSSPLRPVDRQQADVG